MNSKSMKMRWHRPALLTVSLAVFMLLPVAAQMQADDYPDGHADRSDGIETYEPDTADADVSVEVVILTPEELADLVGPIALYPDDLLAIALPASTYPLEIVQAARFLDALEADPSLQPDESWDESVTALLNYPEVLRMMHDDLDWTWKLGGAVLNQQKDVIAAVESFRDRAYAAGNLKSDAYQTVKNDGDAIEIIPADEEIIYVPYYEPRQVVVHQPRPVYHYYPRPCPVYYYPYAEGHYFLSGFFWGVTTAYRIGWLSHDLRVRHHRFHGHPYYGHRYHWPYYRRPSINVYNTWYVHNGGRHSVHRDRYGDRWRPRPNGGARPGGHHSRRPDNRGGDRYEPVTASHGGDVLTTHPAGERRPDTDNRRPDAERKPVTTRRPVRDQVRFRERPDTITTATGPQRRPGHERRPDSRERDGRKPVTTHRPDRDEIRFRERPDTITTATGPQRRPGHERRPDSRERDGRKPVTPHRPDRDEIRFRERPDTITTGPQRRPGHERRPDSRERDGRKPVTPHRPDRDEIRFRERPDTITAHAGPAPGNAAADTTQRYNRPPATRPDRSARDRAPVRTVATAPAGRDAERRATDKPRYRRPAPVTTSPREVERPATSHREPARPARSSAGREDRREARRPDRESKPRATRDDGRERKESSRTKDRSAPDSSRRTRRR